MIIQNRMDEFIYGAFVFAHSVRQLADFEQFEHLRWNAESCDESERLSDSVRRRSKVLRSDLQHEPADGKPVLSELRSQWNTCDVSE